jgi:hypothetical protein
MTSRSGCGIGWTGTRVNDEAFRALEGFVRTCKTLGIAYRVGGSLASSALGVGRTTFDVDVVADLRLDQVDALAAALKPDYYADEALIRESLERGAAFNLVHLETMLKLDVFALKARAYDREAFKRRVHLSDVDLEFFTPEDVILAKLEWYEAGERASERQWSDILGVIRVQADALDLGYLQIWASELNVLGLLEQALVEARA